MEAARHLVTTEIQGGVCSKRFDGRSAIKNIGTAIISWIAVEHGSNITSLTVHYREQGPGTKCGGTGGTVDEVVLEPGEFITIVEGKVNGNCMVRLAFFSNKGKKWGPYGSGSGTESFLWKGENLVGKDLAPRMGLLYFSGSWENVIGHLQATFAHYPGSVRPPRAVVYEQETPDLHSHVPGSLSKFAQTLMSPVVTLNIGPDNIVYRAYEDTLCRLDFFRAALKGEFMEASEKRITMPEDEPEVVSALIEFLYVGTYTYTYKATGTTIKDKSAPAIELKEGFFHARVYALAFKYDCQALADAAKQSLAYVLKGLKGIDVVRLLKETHDKGWTISEWENDEDMIEFRQGLASLLKELYVSNREDMELMISECPTMGSDLMRLLVST